MALNTLASTDQTNRCHLIAAVYQRLNSKIDSEFRHTHAFGKEPLWIPNAFRVLFVAVGKLQLISLFTSTETS